MASASSSRPSPSSEVLNLRTTPAVLQCHDATSQPPSARYLAQSSDSSPIHLNLFYDATSNTVFFKLRVAVAFEGATPEDESKTFVYIFIHPEQVLSLVQEEADKLPEGATSPAARLSSCKVMCLRFVLSKPVSVVVPIEATLRPKSPADVQLLDVLGLLMQQNTLVLYLALDALPNSKRLQLLCRASSNGSLKSHPKHADLSGLYGGRGGKIVQCLTAGSDKSGDDRKAKDGGAQEKDAAAGHDDHLETPPSYDEVAPPPAFSRKRRRVSFESAAPAMDQSNILDICGKLLARQQADMQNALFARMDESIQQIESRLMQRLDQRLDEQMEGLKHEIHEQVVERMDARIDEVTTDVDTLIDERIEDSVLGIKMELESFVKDEVRNVEDDIRDDLQAGSFSIQFNR